MFGRDNARRLQQLHFLQNLPTILDALSVYAHVAENDNAHQSTSYLSLPLSLFFLSQIDTILQPWPRKAVKLCKLTRLY